MATEQAAGSHSGPARTKQRAPGLDGVRALAVLAVMAFHEGIPGALGGYLGVDIFFVLSGYLITDLLVAQRARRARRIQKPPRPIRPRRAGSCPPWPSCSSPSPRRSP